MSTSSVSPRRLRANRRNAKRSTGPRTEEGKARAAQNATGHGIFCKHLLLPGEDPAELAQFCDELLAALDPCDALERSIAEQYVEAKWRIRRVRRAEQAAHDQLAAHVEENNGRCFLSLRKQMRDLPRLEMMNLHERDEDPFWLTGSPDEREDMRERRRQERRDLVPPGVALAESMSAWQGAGPFERLAKYERQLELSADRSLRQLSKLRKDRAQGLAPECEEPSDLPDQNGRGVDPPDDTARTGAPASASTSSDHLKAPVQNEPISLPRVAGHGTSGSCEQGRREVLVVEPALLAGRGANPATSDVKKGLNRT